MPFAFNQIQPTTIGQVEKWDVPFNRWLGLKFGEAYDSGLGSAVSNFTEDLIYDEGPVLKADFANKQFGIPGHLKFDEPVSLGKASLLRRRKEAELERLSYLESASHGWFSAKAFAGFGAGLVGGFSHPLDLGTAFIPFVGSSTKAAELGRLGAGPLERAFARGLITEEGIAAARIPFPRLSAALIEGTLSQAAAEIPVGFEKYRSQAEYGLTDAATNILAGGVFAGGLHLTAKAFKAAWGRAAEFHKGLSPETKDAIPKAVEAALMEGRDPAPDIQRIIDVDVNRIREEVRAEMPFDEAKARQEAGSMVGSDEESPTYKTVTFSPEENRYKIEESSTPKDGVSFIDRETRTVYFGTTHGEIQDAVRIEEGRNLKFSNEDAGFYKDGQFVDRTPERNPVAPPTRPISDERVESTRQGRISEIVAAKKAEHEAMMEGRVAQEVETERQRQIAEGRIMPEEKVKEFEIKSDPQEKDISMLEADAKTIEKDIVNRVIDPEEQAALKEELAALQDVFYKDESKAVQAALPCIGKGE